MPPVGPKWMEHNEVQFMNEMHDGDAAAADDDERPAGEGKYTRMPEGNTCCSSSVRHRNAKSRVNHHKGRPHLQQALRLTVAHRTAAQSVR